MYAIRSYYGCPARLIVRSFARGPVRITSGILRNRRFDVPSQEVRPTKESVREAIFSSLGGRCEGWRVLDLFAGASYNFV